MLLWVDWKKVHSDAVLPEYSHPLDSGFDLRALEAGVIKFGEVSFIRTGLALQLPQYIREADGLLPELHVRSRSGLAIREGITTVTSTVDNGYRGEIHLVLTRVVPGEFAYDAGTRLAQGVISFVAKPEKVFFKEVQELDDSARGTGGIGSTGIH